MLKLWATVPLSDLPISNQAVLCVGCGLRLHLARMQLSRLRLSLLGASSPFIGTNNQWFSLLGFARRHACRGALPL